VIDYNPRTLPVDCLFPAHIADRLQARGVSAVARHADGLWELYFDLSREDVDVPEDVEYNLRDLLAPMVKTLKAFDEVPFVDSRRPSVLAERDPTADPWGDTSWDYED